MSVKINILVYNIDVRKNLNLSHPDNETGVFMANPRHNESDSHAIAEAIEKSERRQWRVRKDYGS
jgi:hypothetical protein